MADTFRTLEPIEGGFTELELCNVPIPSTLTFDDPKLTIWYPNGGDMCSNWNWMISYSQELLDQIGAKLGATFPNMTEPQLPLSRLDFGSGMYYTWWCYSSEGVRDRLCKYQEFVTNLKDLEEQAISSGVTIDRGTKVLQIPRAFLSETALSLRAIDIDAGLAPPIGEGTTFEPTFSVDPTTGDPNTNPTGSGQSGTSIPSSSDPVSVGVLIGGAVAAAVLGFVAVKALKGGR